jgi:hypothetical protein
MLEVEFFLKSDIYEADHPSKRPQPWMPGMVVETTVSGTSHVLHRAFSTARRRHAGYGVVARRSCEPWRLQAATPSTRGVKHLSHDLTSMSCDGNPGSRNPMSRKTAF